jgi:hypothetical protein
VEQPLHSLHYSGEISQQEHDRTNIDYWTWMKQVLETRRTPVTENINTYNIRASGQMHKKKAFRKNQSDNINTNHLRYGND